MRHAFDIVEAWGFTQKTILTWVKDRMGIGDWLRGQTEHCIMAVRGHLTTTPTNQTTVIHAPRREHSRKPEEFYALVEDLCPAAAGGRLDLFQRRPREGWQGHGNELQRFSQHV
jgi:N6-adenosine-specific RNA methylase IME4